MELDADGVAIFEYETGDFCKEPLNDMFGNIYLVVNLEGNTVNIYMFPSYNEAAKYVVQKDKFIYTSEDYRELL